MKLARLHIVELVAHEVDIEWRDDIRRAGHAADLAVLRVGDAGQKVDQPAGDRRIGLFQVEEHGAAIAQMLRDLGEMKAELSAVKAELAGLRERIDDVVISNLRDHGKRMSMLETRVAALEAAENRRAGGMAALVAVAAAAGAAGNVLSRWIAG